jgi:ubiquinone/menaquinone biosynthesis C-methylase UbiE
MKWDGSYTTKSINEIASAVPTEPNDWRIPGSCATKWPAIWAMMQPGSRAKTVVSIGCGCTGDLAAFPASVKVAIDPLLYAYQHLDMLVPDEVGGRTLYLSLGAEDLPLLDRSADLVICRNALDHMPDPRRGLKEMWRILSDDGPLAADADLPVGR